MKSNHENNSGSSNELFEFTEFVPTQLLDRPKSPQYYDFLEQQQELIFEIQDLKDKIVNCLSPVATSKYVSIEYKNEVYEDYQVLIQELALAEDELSDLTASPLAQEYNIERYIPYEKSIETLGEIQINQNISEHKKYIMGLVCSLAVSVASAGAGFALEERPLKVAGATGMMASMVGFFVGKGVLNYKTNKQLKSIAKKYYS